MASGDVNIQTEKEIPPPLKSAIGEPKKTGYKFPHVFFPYKSRYRSPHRQRWWPGSVPRFLLHSHPKRWTSRRQLSFAFFAFHGLKPFAERNLYELMHSLPLRGASSFFWREADSDPWKHLGRKANRMQARGVRTHAASGDTDPQAESGEDRNEASDHTHCGAPAVDAYQPRLERAGRKQLVFSPREIYYKRRPFHALVFGRLTVGQLAASSTSQLEAGPTPDATGAQQQAAASEAPDSEQRHACTSRYLKHPEIASGRSRVAPPQASLGGWKWRPPADASRWIFRPKFPLPHRPELFEQGVQTDANNSTA
ncbi:conserved hypothetical protein [Neospora caninum Liverpool]|uniref:Uncharacterized protein n=1 Tax=Neospora caninum (strain Liverpool) TaxID=572307 RepID=F0VKM8_NEOCL|nr:conserved hypothetical protein [Neospora caninum Liverpool]CBZ54629.1 conserved hypothetical protein [Neospora caninum Liverpool]CEL69345.1 TPA: hypothetical protein BN1204_050570 [Neospora caninum Liverpool]|eukprot:XP_003884659.1 conserved hypothetical protein [Neospora caninum Liverpool]